MEELKNNETSEKKETIEPLEVITLEDDENQVAEEKWIHLLSEEVIFTVSKTRNGEFSM